MYLLRKNQMEPWIEEMIQNYGKQPTTTRVKADVLRSGCIVESLKKLVTNPVALIFLSDGFVEITGVLTNEAWEKLQDVEEYDTVSSLAKCTVVLLRYSLVFQREVEMEKSRFLIIIDELTTIATKGAQDHVPSCTTLPTVQRKICETWRSAEVQLYSASVTPQSGRCMTECLGRLSPLLKQVSEWLSPDPHNHHVSATPTWPATTWDCDRITYKGENSFSIPVCRLYISEQQREEMQRQTAGLHPSVTCNAVEHEDEDYLQDSKEELDFLSGSGNQGGVHIKPWDIFAHDVELDTSSGEDDCPDTEAVLLPHPDAGPPGGASSDVGHQTSPSHRGILPHERCVGDDANDDEGRDSVGGSEDQGCPPPQRTHLHKKPVQASTRCSTPSLDAHSSVKGEVNVEGHKCVARRSVRAQRRKRLLLATNQEGEAIEDKDEEQEEDGLSGTVLRRKENVTRNHTAFLETHDTTTTPVQRPLEASVGAIPEFPEPEASVGAIPEFPGPEASVGAIPEFPGPEASVGAIPEFPEPEASVGAIPEFPEPVWTHPDGTRFSYSYQPSRCVAQALGLARIPNDVLRWAVRYLIHKEPAQSTS